MAALWCRNFPEGAAMEPTVRHMRFHLFAVACSWWKLPAGLVVLGVVLLRSAPMYPALGVCGGGVHLYQVMLTFALYIQRGSSLFRYING